MPEFAVAPNLANTLALIERLPLLESPNNAITYSLPTRMFVVYIPSKMGGVLQVGCDERQAKVVVETIDGKPIKDLNGRAIAPAQTFECPIRPGQYQWFMVLVDKVSGSYGMWAQFSEIGIAREADSDTSDPLIPWNFWYFPFDASGADSVFGEDKLQPCQKYEQAFGATDVLKWEKLNHDNADGEAEPWEGHCHNAAPASVIFKTPPAEGKTYKGVHFLCEELKFLATEYFGNAGVTETIWSLPGHRERNMLIGIANETWLALRDRSAASRSDIKSLEEKLPDIEKKVEEARTGDFQVKKPSDDPEKFGPLAGDFHSKLQSELLFKRRPLMMDLRDPGGKDHSAVWNHAIYKYTAKMWETSDQNNWKDITLETTLNANEDCWEPSSGLPAEMRDNPLGGGKDADPDGSATQRNETLRYRLIFKDNGTVDSSSSKNRWFSATGVETERRRGQTVKIDKHAPRFIFAPKTPAKQDRSEKENTSRGRGNPKIKGSNVLQLLKLRKRFQP